MYATEPNQRLLIKTDLQKSDQRNGPFSGGIPAAAEILWWNNLAEIARLCAVSSI
jgi:hypothetical protein